MPRRFQPIYIPLALSGLLAVLYVGALAVTFFFLVGFPIELHGWGGDIWYVIGFVLFLMIGMYTLPCFLLVLGVIWGVYWLVMKICRYRQKQGYMKKKRVSGRTPEEEIWFDQKR